MIAIWLGVIGFVVLIISLYLDATYWGRNYSPSWQRGEPGKAFWFGIAAVFLDTVGVIVGFWPASRQYALILIFFCLLLIIVAALVYAQCATREDGTQRYR